LREENKRLTDIFSPINENYTIPMEITIWANKEYELEDLAKPLMTYIEQR